MNKKTIITLLLTLVAVMGQAQEIKKIETTFNDYIPMLNHASPTITKRYLGITESELENSYALLDF